MLHDLQLVVKLGVPGFASEGLLLHSLVFGLDCVQADTWDQNGVLVEITTSLTTSLVLLLNLIDESPNWDTLDAPFIIFVLCSSRFSRVNS